MNRFVYMGSDGTSAAESCCRIGGGWPLGLGLTMDDSSEIFCQPYVVLEPNIEARDFFFLKTSHFLTRKISFNKWSHKKTLEHVGTQM